MSAWHFICNFLLHQADKLRQEKLQSDLLTIWPNTSSFIFAVPKSFVFPRFPLSVSLLDMSFPILGLSSTNAKVPYVDPPRCSVFTMMLCKFLPLVGKVPRSIWTPLEWTQARQYSSLSGDPLSIKVTPQNTCKHI